MNFYSKVLNFLLKSNVIFTQITPRTPLLSYTSQCTLFKICTPTTISLTSAQRQRKVCYLESF